MHHLHGIVQGEDVALCLQHSMHLCQLGAAAHERSSQQLFTQGHSVVLVGSICEDHTAVDGLLLTPLCVGPQLILKPTVAGLDMLLAEWLHLILQANDLQPVEQPCRHGMSNHQCVLLCYYLRGNAVEPIALSACWDAKKGCWHC